MPAPWALAHLHELEAYVGGSIPTPILDVGCGRGDFLCELALRGYDAYGVDVDAAKISAAHKEVAAHSVTVHTQQCAAERLPFPDNSFAFVNCSEVIEHVEDPVAALREIYRVLRPDARAYVSFHNRLGIRDHHFHLYGINWLPRRWADAVCSFLGKEKNGAVDRQRLSEMHYFFVWRLNALLRQIGFSFEDVREHKIRYIIPQRWLHRPLVVAYRLLRATVLHTCHYVVRKEV